MKRMSVDDKLGKTKFHVDENHSHIVVDKEYLDKAEAQRLCNVCPAGLYKLDEKGNLQFSYLGCLECGTCRALSLGKIITEWNYPENSYGVSFRFG